MSGDRRGAVVLEFAILAIPFFIMVLGVCEISFDLFMQEAMDLALQSGARQMEIGAATNSKSAGSETAFVQNFVCNTTAGRLLICGNIHVKVEVLQIDSQSLLSAVDFEICSSCNGSLPLDGNQLDLSTYGGSGGASVFCTAPPGSLILVSGIYVGPTFLSGLLPGLFNEYYNGSPVHAVLSQVGVASELFNVKQGTGAAPQC
jgi:Flp pilus assembly protein TadG